MKSYPRDIRSLTSLRFLAAIWVIAYHFVAWLPGVGFDTVFFVRSGFIGVDFFFVLSGFILMHAHADQLAKGSVVFRSFLIRRLAKIYPMHLATLSFYVAMVIALHAVHRPLPNPDRYGAGQLVLNLLLVHAWQIRDAGAWNYPSWSISAEWFAYLLFPWLGGLLIHRLGRVPVSWLLAAAGLALIATWALSPAVLGFGYFSLHANFGFVRILPEFMLGMTLYRFGAHTDLSWLGRRRVIVLVGMLILSLAALDFQIILVPLLALLILVAAEIERQGRDNILDRRAFVYLGKISYSAYMVHLPVATVMLQGARMLFGETPLWAVAAAFPVTIIMAALAYHMIEAPVHRFIVTRWDEQRRHVRT